MKNMQQSVCYLQRLKYHLILYIHKCANPYFRILSPLQKYLFDNALSNGLIVTPLWF